MRFPVEESREGVGAPDVWMGPPGHARVGGQVRGASGARRREEGPAGSPGHRAAGPAGWRSAASVRRGRLP